MKKKAKVPQDDENWASPAHILSNVNKRQLSIASEEENRAHREAINTMGTKENADHMRLANKPRKSFFGNI